MYITKKLLLTKAQGSD